MGYGTKMTCACGDGGCGCIEHPLFQEPMVEGGNLNLKWTDCGDSSYHAKVKALSPTILPIGQKTTMVEGGNLNLKWTDCGDSSYHAKVKALSPTILPIGQK